MKVIIETLPKTYDAFMQMPQMDVTKVENTCAMFLCALNLFVMNKEEGIQAINALRGPRPLSPYDISFLNDRLRNKKYLPLAYFKGATFKNNYTPNVPYELEVFEDSHPSNEPNYLKVFLQTSGADSKRPITLRKKQDCYFLWEYSSILSGIVIPICEDPWA